MLDAKAEKCILVGYSEQQKGYKCYNPQTKQVCVSRDVLFDESTLWYLASPPTPIHSILNFEKETNKAKLPLDEEAIEALEESSISFQLSKPNEELSQKDYSNYELASSDDSCMQSSRQKSRRCTKDITEIRACVLGNLQVRVGLCGTTGVLD